MITEICDKNKCTGCGLCGTICPKGAITFSSDDLGFRNPVVDGERCVDCNLCIKSCPSVNPVMYHKRNDCYLAWSKNKEIHLNSSSGGICYELEMETIRNGGVVVGCVWDSSFNAVFKLIDDIDELKKTVGSKYVQSYIPLEVFAQVKEALKTRKVLFIGLPCQCAAILRSNAENKNLTVVDLLCRGGCSPQCLKTHINHIQKKHRIKEISNIRFRGGENNCWFTAWNGSDVVYKESMNRDSYFYSFMKHSLFHESCYQCQYARIERITDLTIADFWGIDEDFINNKDVMNGYNLVLVHTDNGHDILTGIKGLIDVFERPLQEAVLGNDTLQRPTDKPIDRGRDIRNIRKHGFEAGVRKDRGYMFHIWKRRRQKMRTALLKMTPNFVIKFVKKIIRI